jgi:hypothetical protein
MKRIGASGPNEPVEAIAIRNVTEVSAMPKGRTPDGEQALSDAERQERYRTRHMAPPSLVATSGKLISITVMKMPKQSRSRPRHPADRPSRPQRWRDAVCELLSLQAAYADWLADLPNSLQGSSTAEALEAIVELDLTDLAGVEPPRGYGRD